MYVAPSCMHAGVVCGWLQLSFRLRGFAVKSPSQRKTGVIRTLGHRLVDTHVASGTKRN